MSFRVDLWNGLNIIKSQFSTTINKISNLYNILISYASYEQAYCKNLENLYKDNKDIFKDDYPLDKSIIALINIFKMESEYHKDHYKYIKKNVALSLKEFIEKEKTLLTNLINEGTQIQENFAKFKNNLINKQKNYNNNLKEFYSFISNFDEKELKSILEIDNVIIKPKHRKMASCGNIEGNFIPNNLGNIKLDLNLNKEISSNTNKQQIAKRQKLLEKIYESKNEYNSSLIEANEEAFSYKNRLENVLQALEEKYQTFLSNILSSLITTIDNKLDLINKSSLLYNQFLQNNLNKISIKNDITEFITRNATKEFPIHKFEFISTKFDLKNPNADLINNYLNEKMEQDMNLEIGMQRGRSRKKTEIRRPRMRCINKKSTGNKNENDLILGDKNISNDIRNYKIKTNINLIEDFFVELITKKDEENNIKENKNNINSQMMNINNIKSLIDKKNNNDWYKYLENLIIILNVNRATNCLITKNSYDILNNIFTYILSNYSTIDFVLKNIIILAQTFYTVETNKNQLHFKNEQKKIYLQDGLKNNPIFNKPETWHRVINFTLSNHVFNKDLSQSIDKNEINNKLNIIAYNTLMAYLCDLKYFTDDIYVYEEIKNYYVRVYQLDGEKIDNEVNAVLSDEHSKK